MSTLRINPTTPFVLKTYDPLQALSKRRTFTPETPTQSKIRFFLGGLVIGVSSLLLLALLLFNLLISHLETLSTQNSLMSPQQDTTLKTI